MSPNYLIFYLSSGILAQSHLSECHDFGNTSLWVERNGGGGYNSYLYINDTSCYYPVTPNRPSMMVPKMHQEVRDTYILP